MFKNPFKYYTKIYPENKFTTPEFSFGFLFLERKRRNRNIKIIKMRSRTVQLDNIDLNIV